VIDGDSSTLQKLGQKTVQQLSTLDVRDPAKLEQFINARAPGLNYKAKPGGASKHNKCTTRVVTKSQSDLRYGNQVSGCQSVGSLR
jgi:hypothetical protein